MKRIASRWAPFGVWALLSCAVSAETTPSSRLSLLHHDVVMDKEILITATEVVDSQKAEYPGPWSFGHLIEQAVGKERAAFAITQWFASWAKGARGNSRREALPARPGLVAKLVRPWQEADGFDRERDGVWTPNLANAPFRLLAISNRMDLSVPLDSVESTRPRSSGSAYYSSGSLFADSSAGEARFIFALTDQAGKALEPGTTIILEYGLDALGRKEHILEWATAWHGLGTHDEFDEFYLDDLARLTRAFTDERSTEPPPGLDGNAGSPFRGPTAQLLTAMSELRRGKPLVERLAMGNGAQRSQLLRVRTNEGSFGKVREFRQFDLSRSFLVAAPLPGTPRESFFRPRSTANAWMTDWVMGHEKKVPVIAVARDEVKDKPEHTFLVPASGRANGESGPVVAMVAPVPGGNANYHWRGSGVDPHLRHSFSSQTCCGCHCGDTNTEFFHIAPRERGEPSKLSRFLRTDGSKFTIKDPAGGYSFPSAEMETRSKVLEYLLNHDLDQYQVAEILGDPS